MKDISLETIKAMIVHCEPAKENWVDVFCERYPNLSNFLDLVSDRLANESGIDEPVVYGLVLTTAAIVIDLIDRENVPECMAEVSK
jgi:hypothetical protein